MPDLKEHRLQAGLSIAQVARRAGVDEKTVKRAEDGKPIQEHKARLISNAISEIAGQSLSTEDLGIAIY